MPSQTGRGARVEILLLAAQVIMSLANQETNCRAQPPLSLTVRGMVRQELADGTFTPAPDVKVSLGMIAAPTRTTYTGASGFYYFTSIPSGAYTLTVATKQYDVTIGAARYTELPPVFIETRLANPDKAYASALQAIDQEDWSAALFLLQQLAKLKPETTTSRNSPLPLPGAPLYRPHFYLGVAYFHLNDCPRALAEWQQENTLGSLQYEHHQTVQNLLPKCPPATRVVRPVKPAHP
jgi:hypothetical protein